jgi:sugar lactone lactonase YvrE
MEAVSTLRDEVGESPVWSVAEQALYWVDIESRQIRRYDWATRTVQSWATDERIGSIVLRDGGGLVAGMESGVFEIDLPAGNPHAVERLLFPITFEQPGMRFNDGRCDRDGRYWVSTMVRDMSLASPAGKLYCVTAAGLGEPLVEGLITGNGLAFSEDRSHMFVSDSHPSVQTVWRAPLSADGRMGDREVFVDMKPLPGRPDGAAVDTDGGYWICANDGGQVHRFTADGVVDRSVPVPVSKPSMCAWGGPDLDHLFIASIRPGKPVEGFDASLDGALFVTRPGGRGIAEVPFRSR